jgi:SHS2 domain-containing protein
MKPSFEILEHTADLALRVSGRSLEELFANAGQGFYSLALDELPEGQAHALTLGLSGDSPEQLLIRFLNELVYLLFTRNLASSRFHFRFSQAPADDRGFQHELEVLGNFDPVDPSQLKLEVKSATYHQLQVRERNGVWSADIVFDV